MFGIFKLLSKSCTPTGFMKLSAKPQPILGAKCAPIARSYATSRLILKSLTEQNKIQKIIQTENIRKLGFYGHRESFLKHGATIEVLDGRNGNELQQKIVYGGIGAKAVVTMEMEALYDLKSREMKTWKLKEIDHRNRSKRTLRMVEMFLRLNLLGIKTHYLTNRLRRGPKVKTITEEYLQKYKIDQLTSLTKSHNDAIMDAAQAKSMYDKISLMGDYMLMAHFGVGNIMNHTNYLKKQENQKAFSRIKK